MGPCEISPIRIGLLTVVIVQVFLGDLVVEISWVLHSVIDNIVSQQMSWSFGPYKLSALLFSVFPEP